MSASPAELASFLAGRGTTLDEVRRTAVEAVEPKAGEAILLSGSPMEGLANRGSDLDVYVITPQAREHLSRGGSISGAVPCGGCALDIKQWHPEELGRLLDRAAGWGAPELGDPRRAFSISDEERKVLHRLRVGLPLWGEAAFAAFHSRVDQWALARLNLDWAVAWAATLQMDLVGLLDASDFEAALFVSQTLVGYVFDMALAGVGETNPSPKWRLPLLRRASAEVWSDLPGGAPGVPPAEWLFAAHSPVGLSPEALRRHAEASVDASRRVALWAQCRTRGRRWGPRAATSSVHSAPSARPEDPPLPRLPLGVHFRLTEDGAAVIRLDSELGLDVSLLAVEALLCFDGLTSPAQAAARLRVCTPAPESDLVSSVEDLRRLLSVTGLLDAETPAAPTAAELENAFTLF